MIVLVEILDSDLYSDLIFFVMGSFCSKPEEQVNEAIKEDEMKMKEQQEMKQKNSESEEPDEAFVEEGEEEVVEAANGSKSIDQETLDKQNEIWFDKKKKNNNKEKEPQSEFEAIHDEVKNVLDDDMEETAENIEEVLPEVESPQLPSKFEIMDEEKLKHVTKPPPDVEVITPEPMKPSERVVQMESIEGDDEVSDDDEYEERNEPNTFKSTSSIDNRMSYAEVAKPERSHRKDSLTHTQGK